MRLPHELYEHLSRRQRYPTNQQVLTYLFAREVGDFPLPESLSTNYIAVAMLHSLSLPVFLRQRLQVLFAVSYRV